VAPLHLGTEDLRLPRQERERLTPRSGLAIREARSGDEMVVLGDELLEVIGERPELLPRQVDEPRRLDARTAARQGEVEMRETQAVRGLVGAAQLRALQAPEELVEIARLGGDQLHAHGASRAARSRLRSRPARRPDERPPTEAAGRLRELPRGLVEPPARPLTQRVVDACT